MISRKIVIGGQFPFTARRAQKLVALANSFASSIILQDSRGTFNGKSLLGILSLGKLTGRELVLLAEGRDEERAVEALAAEFEAENESAPA
ncbi:MAG: HPr family phosphocarrier protein [Bacillota bacterium]|nr:HPr family phosphocarrier protein [Bacillota bacterium]